MPKLSLHKCVMVKICLTIIFICPTLGFSQSSVDLLEDILERQRETQNQISQREHIDNMISRNLKSRNQILSDNMAFKQYSAKLEAIETINSNLNKFNLDVSEYIISELEDISENSSGISNQVYLSKSISFLSQINDHLWGVLTYLNKGRIHTGLIDDKHQIEYYETFQNNSLNASIDDYSRNFFDEYVTVSPDIPEEMVQYYFHGIKTVLLSPEHYDDVKQRGIMKDILKLQRERNELNSQLLEVTKEEINLRVEKGELKESDPNAYAKLEGLIKLRKLGIENSINKIENEILHLEFERDSLIKTAN